MDIEIEDISNNDLPKPDNSGNGFGLNLGDYSEPKEVVDNGTPEPEKLDGENPTNPINPINPSSDSWINNPLYYQSGKKAGQLRPEGKLRATYNKNANSSIPATMLINGALFLAVINFIIPLVISTVNNWLTPKEKMTVKDLQLTKEERKEIDPLMDATLKQLNIQGNPLILLSITLVAAYGMKFAQAKLGLNEEKDETKTEKK